MRGLFRRGARQRDDDSEQFEALAEDGEGETSYSPDEFEPFVPVRGSYAAYEDADGTTETAFPEPEVPRRRRGYLRLPRVSFPRLSLNLPVRWDMLLVVIILIASGIFGTLLLRGDLADAVEEWWSVVVLAFAAVWMLVALLRRHVTAFLGAAAVAGVGLSLIMDGQDIAQFEETVLGIVLVTIGLGIGIRGLLLRQRAPL